MSHANAALTPKHRLRIARLIVDEQWPVTHAARQFNVSWATANELGIKAKKTRPYRPQTNGKIERFHRTLADGWAFSRHYNSESARRAALPAWLHEYNHHRPHTATQGKPPITRLTNVPGQYS